MTTARRVVVMATTVLRATHAVAHSPSPTNGSSLNGTKCNTDASAPS
jgi:hypothetical protein